MRCTRAWIFSGLLICLLPRVSLAQDRGHFGLLGVVVAPAANGVEVLHVLRDTPADKTGVQVGDRLLEAAGRALRQPQDLDAALREVDPGEKVAIRLQRGKQTLEIHPPLLHRRFYRGKFLRPRRTGEVGFKAPDWYAYAWDRTNEEPPPTRKTTQGKVVVIHSFQSW